MVKTVFVSRLFICYACCFGIKVSPSMHVLALRLLLVCIYAWLIHTDLGMQMMTISICLHAPLPNTKESSLHLNTL